jgi:hypothetical protein
MTLQLLNKIDKLRHFTPRMVALSTPEELGG